MKRAKSRSKESFIGRFLKDLDYVLVLIGHCVLSFSILTRQAVGGAAKRFGRFILSGFKKIYLFMDRVMERLVTPFDRIIKRTKRGMSRISEARKRGIGSLFKELGLLFVSFCRRTFLWARKNAGYGFALVALVLFVSAINYVQSLEFALEVSYNGAVLGYIEDESVYQESAKMMQDRISYTSEDETKVEVVPSLNVAMVTRDKLADNWELTDKMIEATGDEISFGYGVYLDGQLLGVVDDATAISEFQESKKAPYSEELKSDGVTIELTKNIAVQEGLYLAQNRVEVAGIVEYLDRDVSGERVYQVVSGDTISGIANKNGISTASLIEMNPGLTTQIFPGQTIMISQAEPFIQVKVVKDVVYTETIAYTTQTAYSSKYVSNVKVVASAGQAGEATVKAKITYMDGLEIAREILDYQVTKQPVSEQVLIGTWMPSVQADSSSGGGRLAWPTVPSGYISCGWSGYYGHPAIDIACPTGNPIYAAEAGTVESARYQGSYGNCVVINHGNGLKTLYAHMNVIRVSVGQVVRRGQHIGDIGRTGYATGPHVHFEVRINGTKVNPNNYL